MKFVNKKFTLEKGRQTLLLLFCLFLSFVIWIVHRLSDNQSVYLQYRLVVNTSIPGRAGVAQSIDNLILKGEASGFYALQNQYGKDYPLIELTVNSKFLKKYNGLNDTYYIKSIEIQEEIADFLIENVKLERISNDTILFELPRRVSKIIPVVAYIINNERKRVYNSGLKLTPQFVTAYGTQKSLHSIDTLYTEEISMSSILQKRSGVSHIISPKDITLLTSEIFYSIEE